MEALPPNEPLRISEWPDERLAWELIHKANPQRLAIIAFELMWREERYKALHEAAEQN